MAMELAASTGPTPLESLGRGEMGAFRVIQAAVPLGTRKVALQTLVRFSRVFFFPYVICMCGVGVRRKWAQNLFVSIVDKSAVIQAFGLDFGIICLPTAVSAITGDFVRDKALHGLRVYNTTSVSALIGHFVRNEGLHDARVFCIQEPRLLMLCVQQKRA